MKEKEKNKLKTQRTRATHHRTVTEPNASVNSIEGWQKLPLKQKRCAPLGSPASIRPPLQRSVPVPPCTYSGSIVVVVEELRSVRLIPSCDHCSDGQSSSAVLVENVAENLGGGSDADALALAKLVHLDQGKSGGARGRPAMPRGQRYKEREKRGARNERVA